MKRFGSIAALAFAACAGSSNTGSTTTTQSPPTPTKLEAGMTEEQAAAVVGLPLVKHAVTESEEEWYYCRSDPSEAHLVVLHFLNQRLVYSKSYTVNTTSGCVGLLPQKSAASASESLFDYASVLEQPPETFQALCEEAGYALVTLPGSSLSDLTCYTPGHETYMVVVTYEDGLARWWTTVWLTSDKAVALAAALHERWGEPDEAGVDPEDGCRIWRWGPRNDLYHHQVMRCEKESYYQVGFPPDFGL